MNRSLKGHECRKRAVARPGQACLGCKRTTRQNSRPVARAAFFNDRAGRNFFTSADILKIHHPPLSLVETGPAEFMVASALAQAASEQPSALSGYGQ